MSNLLSKLQEAIREQLPSFAVGYNFPNDPTNAKFAQSIAEAIADSVLRTLADNIDDAANRISVAIFKLAVHEPNKINPDDCARVAVNELKAYLTALTKPQGEI